MTIWTQKTGKPLLDIHLEFLKRKGFTIDRNTTIFLQGLYSVSSSFHIVDLDKSGKALKREIKKRSSRLGVPKALSFSSAIYCQENVTP